MIGQMQAENGQINEAFLKKDEENRQLAELIQEMERRMKKAQANSKANGKFKKEVKDKERDLHKLRKEIIELKHKNAGLGTQLQEEKTKLSQIPRGGPPRLSGQ